MSTSSILITAPNLDTKYNVSGISSVTNFIVNNNVTYNYIHFELGRKDDEKRNLVWFFKMIATVFKWMTVICTKKIKLVHFNIALSNASILRDIPLILFAKLAGKKMVIHIHGGAYLANEKATGFIGFILKKTFSGNTPVIVLSPAEAKKIVADYNIKNVKVLPNCVDLKDAQTFKRVFDNKAALKLLFIGRISTLKGLETIYKALELVKEKNIAFQFFMAGTGADEAAYLSKFSVLLGSNFKFEGIVSGASKTALLQNSDIFLLPSLFEGLPMSLLESMSYGVVPIVTNVGSMKFVVKNNDTGILIDKDPVQETVAAIERFSEDAVALQQMSGNARTFIFENYNPDAYIIALNKIYQAA